MFDWIVGETQQYLELFNFVDMLNWIVWNKSILHLIVCKQKLYINQWLCVNDKLYLS